MKRHSSDCLPAKRSWANSSSLAARMLHLCEKLRTCECDPFPYLQQYIHRYTPDVTLTVGMQILMHLPDDIVTTWAQSMKPKDALMLPQAAINVWCAKTYPLKMDLKSTMLGFPQLVSLASALRCVPKLQELSLRLRTHKKSHGKAYRDAICHPPAYMFKDDYGAQQTACQVCSKCKDDERLSVLAAATPCLTELQKLELVECLFDYGSARQFMWLLAPLINLQVLKIGEGGGQWLFHCARWSLCSAAATLPALTTLDLQGNAWNMISCVLKPLLRSNSLTTVHLNGSLIVDALPEALQDKVHFLCCLPPQCFQMV